MSEIVEFPTPIDVDNDPVYQVHIRWDGQTLPQASLEDLQLTPEDWSFDTRIREGAARYINSQLNLSVTVSDLSKHEIQREGNRIDIHPQARFGRILSIMKDIPKKFRRKKE